MENKGFKYVIITTASVIFLSLSVSYADADQPSIAKENIKSHVEQPEMAAIPGESIKKIKAKPYTEERQMAAIPGEDKKEVRPIPYSDEKDMATIPDEKK